MFAVLGGDQGVPGLLSELGLREVHAGEDHQERLPLLQRALPVLQAGLHLKGEDRGPRENQVDHPQEVLANHAARLSRVPAVRVRLHLGRVDSLREQEVRWGRL